MCGATGFLDNSSGGTACSTDADGRFTYKGEPGVTRINVSRHGDAYPSGLVSMIGYGFSNAINTSNGGELKIMLRSK